MLVARPVRIAALVCLPWLGLAVAGLVDLSAAGRADLARRDLPSSTADSPVTSSPTITTSGSGDAMSISSGLSQQNSTVSANSSAASASSTAAHSSSSPAPTSTGDDDGNDPLDKILYNNTISAGDLPLTPKITPGWGVAGVVLMLSGTAYSLVGIRSAPLHAFFSAAALAGLATTVLILSVMNLPVSNATQGGYVAAAIGTGLVLGVVSAVFREVTECLGCLLGGFCLSMWLLTLRPGGLLQQTGAKSGFIVALSVVTLGLYFTRWTKSVALVGSLSLAGATAAVLGVDCFSRAGLKEFWAYIWALNDDLFPLGTETYPIRKGIGIELACIVVIALLGIALQLKLWILVRRDRPRLEPEPTSDEDDRNLHREEEDVGRQIEETNARERVEWERIYGGGPTRGIESRASAASDAGDIGSEKGQPHTVTTIIPTTGSQSQPDEQSEPIEMVGIIHGEDGVLLPSEKPHHTHDGMLHDAEGGAVVTRVDADDAPTSNPGAQDPEESGAQDLEDLGAQDLEDSGAQDLDDPPQWATQIAETSEVAGPAPGVAPLPFKIPIPDRDEDARSSIAAIVDEEPEAPPTRRVGRGAMIKRLSGGPSNVLRQLSQRSRRNDGAADEDSFGESKEELIAPRDMQGDDNDSIEANLDDLSLNYSDMCSDMDMHQEEGGSRSWDGGVSAEDQTKQASLGHSSVVVPGDNTITTDVSRVSGHTGTRNPAVGSPTGVEQTDRTDAAADAAVTEETAEAVALDEANSATGPGETCREAASHVPTSASQQSLTRDNLPGALPRIAMSYRTNEWAKHLSLAETPEPESLPAKEDRATCPGDEKPAPLDVRGLQQTAGNAALPLATPRSWSTRSSRSRPQNPPTSTARSSTNRTTAYAEPSHRAPGLINRRTTTIYSEPIAEEATPATEEASEPTEQAPSSPPTSPDPASPSEDPTARLPSAGAAKQQYPQTLIGRREQAILTRSQSSLYVLGGFQEPMTAAAPSPRAAGDGNSILNSPGDRASTASSLATLDHDDLPLARRRELIRQFGINYTDLPVSTSAPAVARQPQGSEAAPETTLPSRPIRQRHSYAPADAARQPARTAGARSSMPGLPRSHSAAAADVLGRYGPGAEARMTMDEQRGFLMGLRQAEGRRRESALLERRRGELDLELRMRSGDLLSAHREAIRKLQSGVKS